MKIKWLETVNLTIVMDHDEESDTILDDTITINSGEIDEIDIVGNSKEGEVDIQFGDGSVAFGVSKKWYEIVEE